MSESWIEAPPGTIDPPDAYAEEMSLTCICGVKKGWSMSISANGPASQCAACGRQYRLRVVVEMMEPTP